MKKIILLMAVLFLIPLVDATLPELCTDLQVINDDCRMVTPTLTGCAVFNYSITNARNGSIMVGENLTILNTPLDLYYFNFTLPHIAGTNDYILSLCDGTTREIKVIVEDNMLAIILGLSIAIIMFALLGWIAFKLDLDKVSFWVMFTAWGMAFIELIYMIGLLFINEAGGSLVGLLKVNFYAMAILFFGVGFTVLITIVTRIMSINKQDGKW